MRINDILGAFMFGGEASEKKVKVLSGGERTRLAMIKLLLEPVNLLILDEPTNHLDLVSKEVLKEAIKTFDGTAIIVSHDREFLDGLVEKVYEFGEGKVKEHLGGIYDFLQDKKIDSLAQLELSKNTPKIVVKVEEKVEVKQSYAERKEFQKRVTKLEKAIADSEKTIEALEIRQKELEETLLKPEHTSDMKLINEYTELTQQISNATDKWNDLLEELEKLNGSC